MPDDNEFKDLANEELVTLFEEYNSTPSNPVSSYRATLIKKELERRKKSCEQES